MRILKLLLLSTLALVSPAVAQRPPEYDLYGFNSSRLTNQHVHPTMEKHGALFSFNKPQSFGLVTFDTTVDDPQVSYEVVDIDGNRPHAITVHRSELE